MLPLLQLEQREKIVYVTTLIETVSYKSNVILSDSGYPPNDLVSPRI